MPDQTASETIVIAEDSPPNRKILAHLVEKLGFHVIACEHGEQAWASLNAEGARPATNIVAVLSDIMMPVMDGLELLQHIRGDQRLKDLPVVLITAVSEKDYIVKASALKVNGYILKPVTYQRVHDKLQELFPHKTLPKLAG